MDFIDALYENWLNIWQSFLDMVEPNLPEHLHWNELCWMFVIYLNEIRLWIHRKTSGLEHWEIVTNTITMCFFVFILFEVLRKIIPFIFCNDNGFFNVMKNGLFRIARRMPVLGTQIQLQIDESIKDLEDNAFKSFGEGYITKLPASGMSTEKVLEEARKYKEKGGSSTAIDEGYVSGAVYSADQEVYELMAKIYKSYSYTNPLHPDLFPDVRKMEVEVIRMCLTMFNGDQDSVGTLTSGGTESILMACKCYRDLGRERGIAVPEIIAPYSVHPAFDKACFYFGMKLTHVPVDRKTGRADIKAMKKAISRRTILIVGSVPSFPHGCIDPIEELSKLAVKYNVYLHADCCLGGFLVPFMKKAGFFVPPFDFSLPGVTSISADTHKYGFAPKGSSVVMYRNKEIRKHQYFIQPNWSGGIYASATMPGSRPGNVVACTWAAMMFFGEKGYVESTKKIITTARKIGSNLEKINGIHLMAPVDVSVVSFTSDKFDIFLMSDQLTKRGWHLNPLQFPSGLHIAVTMMQTNPGVAERLIGDVKEIAKELMKNPGQKATGQGAIYGMSQQIPDRSIVTEICTAFLDTYFSNKVAVSK